MSNLDDTHYLLLDIGGVLMKTRQYPVASAKAAGISAQAQQLTEATRDAHNTHWLAYEAGEMPHNMWLEAISQLTGISTADTLKIARAVLHEPFEGATELLKALKHYPLETGCLSNTNPLHWGLMNDPSSPYYLPFHPLQHKFLSFECRCTKPDDKIFIEIETQLNAKPGQIIFFDDTPANVLTAKQRGWQAFLITPNQNPIPQIKHQLHTLGFQPDAC